jgi:hypothetical protein
MSLRLSPIIGSYSPEGVRDLNPMPAASIETSLSYLRSSGDSIYVRCRSAEEMECAPSPLKASLSALLRQLPSGDVAVVMGHRQRGGPTDFYRAMEAIVRRFPVGKAVEVTLDVALRLLNTYPFCFLFHEVDGDAEQEQPKQPTQAPKRAKG